MSKNPNMSKLNSKNLDDSKFTTKKIIIILTLTAFASFIVRLFYFPFDLPLTNDAAGYFWYANDMAILGNFPSDFANRAGQEFPNNGWPAFLSVFFSSMNSNEFLDFVNVQRLIGVTISTLTIIPLYLLISKFLKKHLAILASAVFAFSPRLIENSLLGTTEAPFLLLIITSLCLFLSDKYKLILISFALAALASLVRYEGLLIIIPFTVMFFFRFRKNNKVIGKYLIALSIFILILLPMGYVRTETTGQDGLISHIASGPQYYNLVASDSPEENVLLNFLIKGFTFLMKYSAILIIPMFIIFLPFGIFKFFKNRNENKWTIIIFSLILLIPAFYAYSRGFQEMKYLFILYPFLCICIGYTFGEIEKKINKQNLFFIVFLIGIVSSSFFFTSLMILDFEHQKELYDITDELNEKISTVNRDLRWVSYFVWVNDDLNKNFPILSKDLAKSTSTDLIVIGKKSLHDFNNFEDYLQYGKTQGMEYLVLDGHNLHNQMLIHVFENEEEYPFLKKIFEKEIKPTFLKEFKNFIFGSIEYDYPFHVKAFKIDYNEFENIRKNE